MSNMNLTKRIGNTTFKVSVYFSEKATETMEEKVLRRLNEKVNSTCKLKFHTEDKSLLFRV